MNQVIFSILSHTYLKLKMAGEETEETRWYEGAIKQLLVPLEKIPTK